MGKNTLSVVFLLIITLLMLAAPVSTEPLYYFCTYGSQIPNYTHDSPFENNLKILLEILHWSTPSIGFSYTSVGDRHHRVNGQALCRGDVDARTCQNCIKKAGKKLLKVCKSKDAMIWYELCQVRYSFQMFFSMQVYTGKYPDWDAREKISSNPVPYKALIYLVNNISYEAAYHPSKRMFATGEINFSINKTIYSLVQCTRDISEDDCYNCLGSALGDLDACCYSRKGGMVLSRNCNARFEQYRFYNTSSKLLTYPTSKGLPIQQKAGSRWNIWKVVIAICIPTLAVAALIGSAIICLRWKRGSGRDEERSQHAGMHELASLVTITPGGVIVSSEELPFFDLATVTAATSDFSDSNKLGQGGFGTVYKGVLPNGKQIAIKRLSRRSWQGLEEFKNEIMLMAKLQHRNLVRLLGCSVEGEEKLLIYEFMPNRSLDAIIFDSKRRAELGWKTCYNIICGIARGLMYLHEDSRLTIIHRDLKPSNVLLDHKMVAKISDFGMARIFGEDQSTANTQRVVGTYGYMAPEYAMEGLFSVKSDVFSFGVMLLEIISGKRNSGFYLTEHDQTLSAYAWRLWNEGKELEFIDRLLIESCQEVEVVRCIHVGLLCVQEYPADRPTMSYVVTLLGSELMPLPQPKPPAFSAAGMVPLYMPSIANPSVNQITVSTISPR